MTIALTAWAAAILSLISLYQDSTNIVGYDFYESWVGGDVLRAGHIAGHPIALYSDAAFHDIGQRYEAKAQTQSRRQKLAAPSHRGLYTASTPFFYWVFSVLTPGDYERVFQNYRLIAIACLVASIAAIGWRLNYSIAGIGLATTLAALSEPVYSDFFVANVNCPQLAACVIFLFLRDWTRSSFSKKFAVGNSGSLSEPGRVGPALKPRWILHAASGTLMGMLVAFKPNLLMIPILLGFSELASKRYRDVLADLTGLTIGLATAVAVSSWRFGSLGCWFEWAHMIQKLGSQLSMPSGYGNISISRALFEATGRNLFGLLTMCVLACALAAIWFGRLSVAWTARPCTVVDDRKIKDMGGPPVPLDFSLNHLDRCRRDIEFCRELALFGLAETMTFMTSGLAWLHYPILIFPFVMLMARPNISPSVGTIGRVIRYTVVTFLVVLLMFPPVPSIQWNLPFQINQSPLVLIRCMQAAIILSFGMGLWFAAQTKYIAPRSPSGQECQH